MSPNEWLAIGMIVAFFVFLLIGIPVGISIAATAFFFGYIGFGPMLFNLLPSRIYGVVTNYTFMAIPLFVFMGVMLEKSKLAEELIDVIGHLFGGNALVNMSAHCSSVATYSSSTSSPSNISLTEPRLTLWRRAT